MLFQPRSKGSWSGEDFYPFPAAFFKPISGLLPNDPRILTWVDVQKECSGYPQFLDFGSFPRLIFYRMVKIEKVRRPLDMIIVRVGKHHDIKRIDVLQ